MFLQYYGTGAGAGIPEIFCSCRVCEAARGTRGREIRTRSQAVIDGKLCIDYPVDVFMHTLHGGLDMRSIQHILVTHAHHDHFMADDILSRPQGVQGAVHFYLSEKSGRGIRTRIEHTEEAYRSGKRIRTSDFRVEAHTLTPFEPLRIMEYTVIPLPANHDRSLDSLIFAIQGNGKSLLWAHDSGLLLPETVAYLKQSGILFDFVSLDCTLKRGMQITKSHMDPDWCLETAQMLRENGNADQHTRFAISHIGHLVERTHEELVKEASVYGIEVAYDGMCVEF